MNRLMPIIYHTNKWLITCVDAFERYHVSYVGKFCLFIYISLAILTEISFISIIRNLFRYEENASMTYVNLLLIFIHERKKRNFIER